MIKPTEEQYLANELAQKGDSLKVSAFAGAGKTSTLAHIAENKPTQRGLYLGFNRAIVDDADRKFPKTVQCKTGHSLAFRSVGQTYANRLKSRLTGRIIAEHFNIKDNDLITANGMGTLILSTITRFCQSGDDQINWRNAYIPNSDDKDLRNLLVSMSAQAFDKIRNTSCKLPITHDMYLKWWAMENPVLPYDYIMFDEAQDANGVLLQVVRNQTAQMIYVGDKFQQIYSWRGATNAMDIIKTDHACSITQSFRFGQKVADVANSILNDYLGAGVSVRGFEAINSKIESSNDPDCILFRTNSKLISNALVCLEDGKSPYIVGGVKDLLGLIFGARDLKNRGISAHPELVVFKNWNELVEFSRTEVGSDYQQLIKLIDKYGCDDLIDNLGRIDKISEHEADTILSTAHKSKGREWDTVKLSDDFRYPTENRDGEPKEINPEEYNLLYVAATRAKKILDISDCSAVKNVYSGSSKQSAVDNTAITILSDEKIEKDLISVNPIESNPITIWPVELPEKPSHEEVKDLRERLGMTVKEFSRFCWVTERQIQLIEKGKTKMDSLRWFCIQQKSQSIDLVKS